MVTGFIFDYLPVWLARIGLLARQSFLYRLCAAVFRWFRQKAEESISCCIWQGSPHLRLLIEESVVCRVFDRLIDGFSGIAGRLGGWIFPLAEQSLSGKLLRILPGFHIGWIFGAFSCVMYLVPGPYWRNQYALMIALFLFVLAAVDAYRRDEFFLRTRDLGLGLLLFLFACFTGMCVSGNLNEGIRVFCFFVTAFLLCFAITGILSDHSRLMSMLGFLYAVLVVTGLIAIAQRIIGVEADPSLTDLTLNAGMPGRVYSTMDNPNNYAELIVLFFPLGLVFCMFLPDRRWKVLTFMGLCIPFIALLMTYSRSSWVSFALAAIVFVALYDKRLLPLLIVAAVAAIPVLPESILNRILTIGSTADSSNMYRIYIWRSVLDMLGDYGLTGIGLGPENFIPVYSYYSSVTAVMAPHSHMLYLEVWLEMGVLGLVGFLCMYLGILRRGVIASRNSDPLIRMCLIGCVSALSGIAFVCAAEYIWHYPRVLFAFFTVLGITLGILRLAKKSN